jgi:hypothetical protein
VRPSNSESVWGLRGSKRGCLEFGEKRLIFVTVGAHARRFDCTAPPGPAPARLRRKTPSTKPPGVATRAQAQPGARAKIPD